MLPENPRPGYAQLNTRGAKLAASPVADRVLRFAFGFAAGMAICGQIAASLSGTEVDGREGLMSVPLVPYGFIGFALGVLASPIGLLMTRGMQPVKYLFRSGLAFGCVMGLLASMLTI